MSLNPKKCELLHIANKKYPVTCNYFIDSTPIKEVPHSKYLGVIIDNKFSWNPHIQHITTTVKPHKSMFFTGTCGNVLY